ncbi:hypothetical protein IE4803_PB00129 (plasmid) [Rhizobium etli bv. phaseoli str. IE4803]|nr:hypothetical protein IE4803_PB00129 [Rhizobium etli bv. phaseoli str. IE4803]
MSPPIISLKSLTSTTTMNQLLITGIPVLASSVSVLMGLSQEAPFPGRLNLCVHFSQ